MQGKELFLEASEIFIFLQQTKRQRVIDGAFVPILSEDLSAYRQNLVLIWSQLGDFDSLEYAWWLHRERQLLQRSGVRVRAVGIGNRASGQKFCQYTGFPEQDLFVDPTAELHHELGLYAGLKLKVPGLSAGQCTWVNLMLMCAGLGSPGTLAEVLRGYLGDRRSLQLIADEEIIKAGPLPPLKGKSFSLFGRGFQRPIELATLRLRNMTEVLSHWPLYVPDATYLTQRGATYLFDGQGTLLYAHRDPGILGFAANMSRPLDFLG
ncbi:MAG: AhpC/TSA family protein [Gemmatimonadaceae bacterium]|nr:AhpC/TSA family protein [Gloeobacterales cyanobacterium ES-bin-141]